jgi:imidazolonepropionase-like amidohydrolase
MIRAVLAAAALLSAVPAAAQDVAISGGRVVTNMGPVIDGATVVLRAGRVLRVDAPGTPAPAGARVIDATGKWVTPGLVAGFSQIGLSEVTASANANDTAAPRSPVSAALDAAVAFNPNETSVPITRRAGVTAALVAPIPAGEIFAGHGLLAAMGPAEGRVMAPRAFQYVAFGTSGGQLAGGSRPAAWAEILNALDEARRIQIGLVPQMRDQHKDLRVTREDAEALGEVIAGRQPLFVRADRASDIRQLLGLRQRYPQLRLVLVSAHEGWLVADEIARAGVPVVTLGVANLPGSFDQVAATLSNVGRLVAAGVTVALGTPDLDASFQPRLLPQYAGILVGHGRLPDAVGLSWDQAFAAISRAPADILGRTDLGRLAPGARADVVVWSGDPLELASWPEAVFVEGVEADLETRQSRLARRYRPGQDRDALPEGYRR